jgi:membrane protein CcdC involved in cytochrome C biogenesis|tara:strand:+ start:714 stop:1004 length:291 start_codon:yes stop_codon:yes gene_type:complete
MITAGLLSALGLLFLIFKFGIRRVIAYDIPIDIVVTGLLMYLFAGTYSGMLAAMIAGLIVSVTLFAMKKTMYREELKVVKTSTFPYRAMRWIGVKP